MSNEICTTKTLHTFALLHLEQSQNVQKIRKLINWISIRSTVKGCKPLYFYQLKQKVTLTILSVCVTQFISFITFIEETFISV